MKFKAIFGKDKLISTPLYISKDSSFLCEPYCGDCAILFDNSCTSLDVSLIDNTICGISGYNPKEKWIRKTLTFPRAKALNGQLKLITAEEIPFGSAISYNREWLTFFDEESNVICIGTTDIKPEMILVEFCTNVIACLLDSELISIWVSPLFTDTYRTK